MKKRFCGDIWGSFKVKYKAPGEVLFFGIGFTDTLNIVHVDN